MGRTIDDGRDKPAIYKLYDYTMGMYIQIFVYCKPVLGIHDILGWIRIRGSMPLTNGSGSGSCYFRLLPSRCQQKTNFFTQFFCLLLL